jgi:hypothetical protein
MSQGNCTLCAHSHMHEQLGQLQRVCRKGPPVPVALPQRGGMFVASLWPAVDDKMACDAFEVSTEPGPRLAFGRTIDS